MLYGTRDPLQCVGLLTWAAQRRRRVVNVHKQWVFSMRVCVDHCVCVCFCFLLLVLSVSEQHHPTIATELPPTRDVTPHPAYSPRSTPKWPKLALTFTNERRKRHSGLLWCLGLWVRGNSPLLFASPPVAIWRRTPEGFPPLQQLAGSPLRYIRHKRQWSQQLLFRHCSADVNGTSSVRNDNKPLRTFIKWISGMWISLWG